ncbi:DNA mismatch repair protein MutS [Clostridiales bacterium CHKCI001]|nr:DNA mismatch repair protein MutS [Clostridiales bacterium CHKCI001]
MEKYIYIGLGIALLIAMIYPVVTAERRRRSAILGKIVSAWGQVPKREYEYSEFEKIAKYYKATKGDEFTIDDITWNDLDMDRIFMMINNTSCSTGEEYLYKVLRTPVFDQKILDERNRVAEYFATHDEVRLQYQIEFSRIGYTKKIALIDYIHDFANLNRQSNLTHYLHIMLIFASILLLVTAPSLGILAFFAVMAYNIIMYYKDKSKIEPYFISVGVIVHMIMCCQELAKHKEPELKQYLEKLGAGVHQLKSIRSNAKWLGETDKSSGNPADIIMEYIRMMTHIDLIKFNTVLGKVQKYMPEIEQALEIIGQLDSCIAIASYRQTLPFYCRPKLVSQEEHKVMAKDLYHPLISEPVANSIYETRPVLLTGSNASGKSTFLKTVAINAILAQTIDTVMAHSYESNFFRIYSSMALQDNLQGKESYYIVEIKSLKRILDAAQDRTPILCFVDEVLRGTNTVERIAASSRILQNLAQSNVMCFAATHDIELTHMLTDYYENYHFTEEIKENDILFSYQLHKGRATTRNAIRLLKIMGYEEDVIQKADETAQNFMKTGTWSL